MLKEEEALGEKQVWRRRDTIVQQRIKMETVETLVVITCFSTRATFSIRRHLRNGAHIIDPVLEVGLGQGLEVPRETPGVEIDHQSAMTGGGTSGTHAIEMIMMREGEDVDPKSS